MNQQGSQKIDAYRRASNYPAAGQLYLISVSDYLVTSVDFTSMIEQLMNYGFSVDTFFNLSI